MSEPRILFGVGATKAGTSWLHRWLERHPECRLRTVKELHFFDTLEADRFDRRIVELTAEREALSRRGARAERLRDIDELLDVFAQRGDLGAYVDYLHANRGAAAVVGDITPSYGLLPEPRLKEMDSLGEARFLCILRDPVARLWSHVRMIASRRDPSGAVAPDRAARILNRVIRGDEDEIERRSDYRGVLMRLASAVPPARRLVVFFEDLFGGDAPGRICNFLGISQLPALTEVIHAGRPLQMTEAQRRDARGWLDTQYAFVSEAMGPLPAAWSERV